MTSAPDVKAIARRFQALGHESRVEIVRSLLAAHPSGRVASELQDELAIPASTLSHHLDALRHEGLVEQEREGRFVRYRAGTAALQNVLDFLYAECCSNASRVNITIPS